MSDTKPLDVTQQVTQALSNKELLPKHEPLPKFVNESLKDIYKRMPGVSRGCANSIYLQGLREGLTESRKENEALRELLERAKELVRHITFLESSVTGIVLRDKAREEWLSDYEKLIGTK